MTAPACDPTGHCVTCSDEGIPMRVVSVSEGSAVCVDADDVRHEGVAVDLVEPIGPGDSVLVHAGVAIA